MEAMVRVTVQDGPEGPVALELPDDRSANGGLASRGPADLDRAWSSAPPREDVPSPPMTRRFEETLVNVRACI